MSAKIYRLEIVHEFESQQDAIAAAVKSFKSSGKTTRVVLYEELRADSGQPCAHYPIWRNGQDLPRDNEF